MSVFNEATWRQFREMPDKVCAYSEPKFGAFPSISIGNYIVCYISKKMVWAGLLRVSGERYRDQSPIYQGGVFPLRVPVESLLVLDPEEAVPMAGLEGKLSFFPKGSTGKKWAPYLQKSPRKLADKDGEVISSSLSKIIT